MTFAVERTIDGIKFLKDEDYIEAEGRDEADLELMMGILSGRFDLTCKIIGKIIGEIEISTDEMLDIMIKEKLCLKKGDRVRLKKDFDPERHRVSGAFVPQMDKYIGKTFIVEEVEGGPTFNYVLNDNWAFRFNWLELADDSQTESVCIAMSL